MTRHALLIAGIVVLVATAAWSRPLTAPLSKGIYLQALTWVEVRALIRSGKAASLRSR